MPAWLEQTLWLFLIYAFLGWCTEVAYHAVTTGKFINRGMANGPVCPIYGFGVLLVLVCLEPVKDHFLPLFLGAVVLTSALELFTGWILEVVFHDKWWDYTNQPFNLKGYICLKFSLAWGLACVLVVRVIHPSILALTRPLYTLPGRIALAVLLAVFLTDEVITFIQLFRLPRRLQAIEDTQQALRELASAIGQPLTGHVLTAVDYLETSQTQLEQRLAQEKDAREQQSAHQKAQRDLRDAQRREELRQLQAQLELQLSRRSRVQERLLRAFPTLQQGRHREAIARLREWQDARKNK